MTNRDRLNDDLRVLLLAAAAGEADEAQWSQLERVLKNDGAARDYAVTILHQMSALEWSASDALAQVELNLRRDVPTIGAGLPAAAPKRQSAGLRWFMTIAATLLILGLSAWLARVGWNDAPASVADRPAATPPNPNNHEPPAPLGVGAWVARLKQSTPDATWGINSGPNEFLLRLQTGQTMELLSGLAEVEFVSGAVVILHGPSVFTPTGPDSATLQRGRVTGRAENGNFRLVTPSARVVDLGTEFGVVVDEASNTNVVVFEGEVSVAPSGRKKRRVEAIFLDHGATARIDANGEFATGISVEWEAFKRAMPDEPLTADELLRKNQLSVIDIVSGGDGRGRTLAGAIDPLTGTWDQRPWQHEHGPGRLGSDGQYHHHRSASHPMIDGVFIPSPAGKNTRITSSGDRANFPANIGATWGPIWARRRGNDLLLATSGDFWGSGTVPFIVRRIEASRIGALGMHPNVGMTLDLHDGSEPYRGRFQNFEATLTNLDLAEETDPDGLRRVPVRTADFWVFVDGKLKYSRRNFGRDLEGEPFKVELASEDRFLTLVATDGGNSISFDHVLLIDPVLTLSDSGSLSSDGTEAEN